MKSWLGVWLLLCCLPGIVAQELHLPPRPTDAVEGTEMVARLTPLDLKSRELEVLAQVAAGNVPDFLRRLCPVTITNTAKGRTNVITFHVAPDYLAVGSDSDHLLMPLSPGMAQRIADLAHCGLPTPKMVDAIYAAATVKLPPSPIPPGPAMTTVPVFAAHALTLKTQRMESLKSAPLGALTAGHKKDVVVSTRLAGTTNRVALYGWHRTNGAPIQPLYTGHTAEWVDYSHGIRLTSDFVTINGRPHKFSEVLADAKLAGLLSDEGPVLSARYVANDHLLPPLSAGMTSAGDVPYTLADFKPAPHFEERTLSFAFDPGVKIHINMANSLLTRPNSDVLLVFYALPNGNTTPQTIGKNLKPGDDWHFNIQHIGAQTRWLRRHTTGREWVVAYLENDLRSWPAWRRQHGDERIPSLLGQVKSLFQAHRVRTVLTGHSGGGSLNFGYLNSVAAIPDDIERIAFLDSNYAYETSRHEAKLVNWLKASQNRFLCVLAYNDAVALLEGKPFISAAGGTWGRSQAMLEDFGRVLEFARNHQNGLQSHIALRGRVQFLMKQNPERRILHTVQVERNGFIHAMLTGTSHESDGYVYFGERVYGDFISPE